MSRAAARPARRRTERGAPGRSHRFERPYDQGEVPRPGRGGWARPAEVRRSLMREKAEFAQI